MNTRKSIRPSAGGFHPYGALDAYGDATQNVLRYDFYADKLCDDKSPTFKKCGELVHYEEKPLERAITVEKYV